MFGTNDATKVEEGVPKYDWNNVKAAYKEAYKSLINDYKTANPNIEIIMMTSPPVLDGNVLSIDNTIIDSKVYPAQLEIAKELGIKILDFRAYVKGLEDGYRNLYLDGVHFNETGAELFGKFVARAL